MFKQMIFFLVYLSLLETDHKLRLSRFCGLFWPLFDANQLKRTTKSIEAKFVVSLLSVIAFPGLSFATTEQNPFIDWNIPFFYDYPIVEYEQLDFSQMELRKATKHPHLERNIYFDPKTKTFVKQWPPNFLRNSIFLDALISGYYKNLTPLEALLFDKEGHCRGYITKALDYANLSLAFFTNTHNYLCLQEAS